MKKNIFSSSRQKIKSFLFILCLLPPILYCQIYAYSETVDNQLIQLITPQENMEVIAKKPKITCSIKIPFDPEKLLVLLDGTDITALLSITPEGFECKPLMVLPPGSHTLSVTLSTPEGNELKREFNFSTRHTKALEEVSSNNELSTVYEKKLVKSGDVTTDPSYKFESNLKSESKLKEKEWEFTFNTNLRYFDQNVSASSLEKGFGLGNYLFQGKYTGKRFQFLSEMGDVTINETQNTVQWLGRRGGNLVFQSQDLHLQIRTFVVKSEQVTGFKGGMGIEGTTDDHIMGISGDLSLFSEKLRFRTVYVRGGEEGSSFGISTTPGKRKGDVLGFVLNTDIFKGRLGAEAEIDFSRFDPDTGDEFPRERDKAYRLKLGGAWGKYTYEALYEYMGPDYEVIGNQGLQKNRQGFILRGGANYEIHLINLSFSRDNDNVKKEELFPRIYNSQGTIDYTFNKFKNLPIGLSYQRSMQDSTMEPALTTPIKTDTDTITGKINYLKGPWNFGFQTSYSLQNDKTFQNNDTTALTCSLTPTYTLEYLSISPNFSFNRSKVHLTGIHTDTYTTTLDLRGNLFEKRLTYELAGTYNWTRASDGSSKQQTVSSNFRVAYPLAKNLWGFLNPSVGIRGLYNRTNDRVLHHTTDEFALLLVLSTSMSFSF